MFVKGNFTMTAGEALEANRRVKGKSGSTTTPPEVVYADAGEQAIGSTVANAASGDLVTLRPCADPGIHEGVAADTFSLYAILYAAADGKISDTSSGSAIGIALEAATAAGDHVMWLPFAVLSTTAGTVSIADTGGFTAAATVEAALAEIYQHLKSAQAIIPIPLGLLKLEDGTPIDKFADGASATPGMSQESNKEVVLRWNNHATPTKVAASGIPLPPDLDPAAPLVVHWRAKMSDANDTPTLEHEVYLGAGDTDCAGTDDEVDGGITLTEYAATVLAADIAGAPEEMTLIFGPADGELGTDDLLVYSVWLEYTKKVLTS